MNSTSVRIATAATVFGLGGLAGLALGEGRRQSASTVAATPAVHTKVVHRTIHVTKHAKPKHPAIRRPASGQKAIATGTGPSGYSAGTRRPR